MSSRHVLRYSCLISVRALQPTVCISHRHEVVHFACTLLHPFARASVVAAVHVMILVTVLCSQGFL